MESADLGVLLAGLGLALLISAALLASGMFGWIGRLPGDLHWGSEGGGVQVYAPLASTPLGSLALTALLGLLGRLFR